MANNDRSDEKFGTDFGRSMAGVADSAGSDIKEVGKEIRGRIERTGRAIADQSEEVVDWIKARPVTSFAIGAALGAVIGVIIGRSIR